MKLSHINLTVIDAQETRKFLEKYFGLRSMEGTKEDDTFIGLLDDEGFVLTVMQGSKTAEVSYPAGFHIGFLKRNEEEVIRIYQLLKNDGFYVKPPRHSRGPGLDFYFNLP